MAEIHKSEFGDSLGMAGERDLGDLEGKFCPLIAYKWGYTVLFKASPSS